MYLFKASVIGAWLFVAAYSGPLEAFKSLHLKINGEFANLAEGTKQNVHRTARSMNKVVAEVTKTQSKCWESSREAMCVLTWRIQKQHQHVAHSIQRAQVDTGRVLASAAGDLTQRLSLRRRPAPGSVVPGDSNTEGASARLAVAEPRASGGSGPCPLGAEVLSTVWAVCSSGDWDQITSGEGVTVFARRKQGGTRARAVSAAHGGEGGAVNDKFAVIKAVGTIDAPIEEVHKLFVDNSRVGEYNDHCHEIKDLEWVGPRTKVTWSASGKYGPFKARDFCTLVHFATLADGTQAIVSVPFNHPQAPATSRYVRSEVIMAGHFMRRDPKDPNKTAFTTITQVNPGGIAGSAGAAKIVNSLSTQGPITFVKKVELAAQQTMKQHSRQHSLDNFASKLPAKFA